ELFACPFQRAEIEVDFGNVETAPDELRIERQRLLKLCLRLGHHLVGSLRQVGLPEQHVSRCRMWIEGDGGLELPNGLLLLIALEVRRATFEVSPRLCRRRPLEGAERPARQ